MIKNLKKLRTEKGISQQQLADIIGVSQQSVNKYENHNSEPELAVLINMANCFNTSVDYLIGNSEFDHVIEVLHPYDLNQEEIQLVEQYRILSDTEKESINLIIKNYLSKDEQQQTL
ncbi:MAG: helix-turn-helix transcriptional regulator [Faecalibacterium sp.]|nr:helix-turn-helix transcriptional regulator [Ruminococcus sp.]MCM1392888.1 helix-turn-helix transcriptional regulator [Ruminococcus sp.]MCM1486618.1 helix-turn-helix transcriptional regulator [Faecalibacterium sp.]